MKQLSLNGSYQSTAVFLMFSWYSDHQNFTFYLPMTTDLGCHFLLPSLCHRDGISGCSWSGRLGPSVSECKAGRCSGRKCAFSKLFLGKQSLILPRIPLVCNQDYIIANPSRFIRSAVEPRRFAKKHMPPKILLCHHAAE